MAKDKDRKQPESTQDEPKKAAPAPAKKKRIVRLEMGFGFEPRKSLIYLLLLLLFVPFLFSLLRGSGSDTISLSQLLRDIKDKKVEKIEIDGATLTTKYNDGR